MPPTDLGRGVSRRGPRQVRVTDRSEVPTMVKDLSLQWEEDRWERAKQKQSKL